MDAPTLPLILGQSILEHLHYQFPPTRGYIPLQLWVEEVEKRILEQWHLLDQSQKALAEGYRDIVQIKELLEDFQKQAFKVTTPATVEYVKQQPR